MTAKAGKARPPARSGRRRPRRRGGAGVGPLLVLLVPAAIFVAPTTLLVGIGMIPTFVAFVVDRDPEKPAPITVGGLNLCGVLPYVLDLWSGQNTLQQAIRLLGDPTTWLVMFGAAAVGWACYHGIPGLVAGFEIARAEARIATLQKRKRRLAEDWGADVAENGMGEKP